MIDLQNLNRLKLHINSGSSRPMSVENLKKSVQECKIYIIHVCHCYCLFFQMARCMRFFCRSVLILGTCEVARACRKTHLYAAKC